MPARPSVWTSRYREKPTLPKRVKVGNVSWCAVLAKWREPMQLMLIFALLFLAICQPGSKPANPPVYITGELRNMDLETGKVAIVKNGQTGVTRYRLDTRARYFQNSKPVKAADLVSGDKVTLQLDLTTNLVIGVGGGVGMPDVREAVAREAKEQPTVVAPQPRRMAGVGAAPVMPRRMGPGRFGGSPQAPLVNSEPAPEGTIRASSLWLEFDDCEQEAGQQYKGTVVRLFGSVAAVQNGKNGKLYVGFETIVDVQNRQPGVHCYLKEAGKPAAAKISKGDKVIVSGKIVGRQEDKDAAKGYVVVLEECTVEK
jgi:tRNA_anti-like